VPAHFTGTIALFAVFRPDSVPIKANLLDGWMHISNPYDQKTRALVFASDAAGAWHVAKGVEEKGSALGVGFSGTSGFGRETDSIVYFDRNQKGAPHADTAASDTASEPAPVSTPANGTPVYSDTTYRPAAASPPAADATAGAEELPGRPYPNPPTDAEAISAINSFLGEVQDGKRTIQVLGYRQMCAQPIGPECHVVIDGHVRKVLTLTRTADGRLEASDLGSCGD
jgi:hypothetical protein